ncbi:hypothetical protein DSM112329_04756 [Paraconexibacter sp. AEG42_29]|uniref:Uncharacterized protein n=1 Tax=Paraconexibacter sp. AEG42_29 TaxID=2997339 RepID=A0AAU7B2V0_9ACTN
MDYGGVLIRLEYACAMYRRVYGTWPKQARFQPDLLHHLTHQLSSHELCELVTRLELRARPDALLSVGGLGVVEYGGFDVAEAERYRPAARDWLYAGFKVNSHLE